MDPPPQTTTAITKLRLMCSYGGHIIPRPKTKSLFYSGGDTRIITLPNTTTTLSTLTSHISTTLNLTTPFTLKYQLPNHDLDSLITLSTDEDLFIMLDEHSRLSPARARIRLFVFCCGESKVMMHPKSDSWFVDALKNAKIGGGECESLVLETTSSFGSASSSSASLSNLPVKTHSEDPNFTSFQDVKSVASDHSVSTAVSHPQMVTYQEIGSGPVTVMENKVFGLNPVESENRIPEVSTDVEMNRTGQLSGFPFSLQYDQSKQVQFVHSGGVPVHYVPHNPTGAMPGPPYYVMHPPGPQQQLYYHANQPQTIYLVPVAQPYGFPMQSGVANNPAVSYGHAPLHPNMSSGPAQAAYRVTSASPAPELASQVYGTVHMATPIIDVSHKENNQKISGVTEVNHTKPVPVTSAETADRGNELDNPLHAQIYKSQPPAPILPSHHQTMTNATTVLLSGAFTQLHTDNVQHG